MLLVILSTESVCLFERIVIRSGNGRSVGWSPSAGGYLYRWTVMAIDGRRSWQGEFDGISRPCGVNFIAGYGYLLRTASGRRHGDELYVLGYIAYLRECRCQRAMLDERTYDDCTACTQWDRLSSSSCSDIDVQEDIGNQHHLEYAWYGWCVASYKVVVSKSYRCKHLVMRA